MNISRCRMIGLLDIRGQDQIRRVYSTDALAPTLTTSGGGNRQVKIFDFSKYRVRKLTPTEYGRLQAFPMGEWKQVVSDSQAYKQFGNAVTTTLFTAIAGQIKTAIIQAEEFDQAIEDVQPRNKIGEVVVEVKVKTNIDGYKSVIEKIAKAREALDEALDGLTEFLSKNTRAEIDTPNIYEGTEADLEAEICRESGLLNPNGCGKTLRVEGGR